MIIRRLLLLCLLCWSLPLSADEIRLAVASNFLGPVQEIARVFERESGHKVLISAGSTGKLYAQIVNGAPYDLFLAANTREPRRLEEDQRIQPGSRYTYAIGVLALWAPMVGDTSADDPMAVLAAADGQRVAIANPQTAPYGAAAEAVLKAWGQWDKLQGRIIRGENIAQAYQFTASGNAGFGFVALSQLLSTKQVPGGRYWRIDDTLYPPIRQQLVILKRAAAKPAAQAFRDYLGSADARAMIQASGYGLE